LTDSAKKLQRNWKAFVCGSGPLAVDAERAQSFRYTAKAYLVQLRRGDGPTMLLDPLPFEKDGNLADFSALSEDMEDVEWVIHAAGNDLQCLFEIGLKPGKLFDTELAGRLLGIEKVNISALMEQYLGIGLAKGHAAENWSIRPLPQSWRNYAALDVERLSDLRDALEADLIKHNRLDIAQAEFEHTLTRGAAAPKPQTDPWRHTGNIHLVRSRRGMAIVRELWNVRDEMARQTDTAPCKIITDKAISAIAAECSDQRRVSKIMLSRIPEVKRRQALAHLDVWAQAVNKALAIPASELPPRTKPKNGFEHQWKWKNSYPQLHARYQRIKADLVSLSERIQIPYENLCEPVGLRQLLWDYREGGAAEAVEHIGEYDLRQWQCELSAPVISADW
jgi:ribonuclease D